MNIIIPLAGNGQRFIDDHYFSPKPLINVLCEPIIVWVLNSLKLDKNDTLYIIFKSDLNKFNFKEQIKHRVKNKQIEFIEISNETRGASETVLFCAQKIPKSKWREQTLILDGDTFYTDDIVAACKQYENIIFYHTDKSSDPIYSYISIDEHDTVRNIKEKEKISDYACIGAYGFASMELMVHHIQKIISSNIKQKNEFYISTVYRSFLEENIKIIGKEFPSFHNLGTPNAVKIFASNISSSHKKYRFCFDIDNTLLSYPDIVGDYTTVRPINRNVNFVKALHKQGHTIILYTARRMKTHNGNVGKVQADIAKITIDSLNKYHIPYDELYFGKPYADFYIDDLAINAFDSLEKGIGIYNIHPTTRDHNKLEIIDDVIIKTSTNITGEKYYYSNIPQTFKNYFPKLISSTQDSITIEKIYGIPLSSIYTNRILTEDILIKVLKSVDDLHQHTPKDCNINIYSNYVEKLRTRISTYDYSIFDDYKDISNNILHKLSEYENSNSGVIGMIHGDPVFSNILLDLKDNIKFIDMRGSIANQYSIYGDIFYDYGKIYQSLIGYDFILMDENININYINRFIQIFEKYILNKFNQKILDNIKLITDSLLLSLIPLHNNQKIFQYYNLINKQRE
jgi:capsule biosynthesis phosphatase